MTGLGLYSLLFNETQRWSYYVQLVIGILYILFFYYDLTNQYLRFENSTIRKNRLYGFSKPINFNEIKSIEKYAGDYIIRANKNKLKIKTNLIEPNSLTDLDTKLEKLNVQWL